MLVRAVLADPDKLSIMPENSTSASCISDVHGNGIGWMPLPFAIDSIGIKNAQAHAISRWS
jgi:hypothetical protein